ncbi:MAG: MATE family efflux transporter [Rikenellaceae bacterium]
MKKMGTDFTKGKVESKLIKFAIPIIIGNILMQLYQYTDSVIVGRFVGKEALAAIGATTPFVFMLVSLVIGISIGSTVLIAQFFGKNEIENIRKASDSLYIFLFFAAVVITSIGLIFNRYIMELISLPSEIIPLATSYLNIYLFGLIFLFLFNSLSAILRGLGDSKSPLYFLVFSSIINILLDLLFVAYFDFGIKGAAWATVISQLFAIVFATWFISKRNSLISLNPLKMRFDKNIFLKSIKIGIPAGAQQLFVSMGMMAILSFVNSYGTDTIAGYTAASRIEAFVFVIPMNLSMAITTFTAQNYGANQIERVKKGVNASMKISMIASIVVLILLSALAPPLMKMFSSDTEVIATGASYLYVLGFSYAIFCAMFCYMGALRGMGNTIVPMFITLFSLWLVRVPLAKVLSQTSLGELGIWLSGSLSWLAGAITAYIYYRKGYQKQIIKINKEVIENADLAATEGIF